MTRDELVHEVRDLRQHLDRLNDEAWSPAVERSLRLADVYLHFVLWQLGEVEELTPELRGEGAKS